MKSRAAIGALLAAAAAAVVAARGARGTTPCVSLDPEQVSLQLLSVEVEGVAADLSQHQCTGTALTASGFVNDRAAPVADVEILAVREDDGGTSAASGPCQGRLVRYERLGFTRVAADGGAGDGG